MPPHGSGYTTKELSEETWPDYERFFSRNGRGSCACMLYQRGGHLPARRFPSRAEWRVASLREKQQLVEKGRAHGILVYADGEAVGWCQYGPVSELPLARTSRTAERLLAKDPTSQWRITCFVTLREHRRQGVAAIALAAALEAIGQRGGGWVEAVPIVSAHRDEPFHKLKLRYGPKSRQVEEHLNTRRWPNVVVPGIGPVKAADGYFGNISHQGTVSMFERAGFEAVRTVGDTNVLMRRHV